MPKTLKSQVVVTLALLENGEWRRAANLAGRILATYPQYTVAYALNARAHLGLGVLGTAAKLLQRVLSANPENAEAYMSLGLIYHTNRAYPRAESCLLRAYELTPGDVRIRQALGVLYFKPSDTVPASFPLSRFALARIQMRGELQRPAIVELELLHQQLPERADIAATLCEAYWQDNLPRKCAAVASDLLNKSPWCLKANIYLGKLWLNTDQDDLARACLDLAQSLDPENRWAQALLGNASPLPARIATLNWDDQDNEYEREQQYLYEIDEDEDTGKLGDLPLP